MSSVTTGGGPPRLPADAQTLPPVDAVAVEAAALLVVVALVSCVFLVLVFIFFVFFVLDVVSAAAPAPAVAVVVAASVVVSSGGAPQSTTESAADVVVVATLLPAATLVIRSYLTLGFIRRLNLFGSNIRDKQILGEDTAHRVIRIIATVSLGRRIADLTGSKSP